MVHEDADADAAPAHADAYPPRCPYHRSYNADPGPVLVSDSSAARWRFERHAPALDDPDRRRSIRLRAGAVRGTGARAVVRAIPRRPGEVLEGGRQVPRARGNILRSDHWARRVPQARPRASISTTHPSRAERRPAHTRFFRYASGDPVSGPINVRPALPASDTAYGCLAYVEASSQRMSALVRHSNIPNVIVHERGLLGYNPACYAVWPKSGPVGSPSGASFRMGTRPTPGPTRDSLRVCFGPVAVSTWHPLDMDSCAISVSGCLPPLRVAVGRVIGVCPEEQMPHAGPDARRVIAGVQHAEPFRYWPNEQGPCDAVRTSSSSRNCCHAVAVLVPSPSPEPAFAGPVHLSEEAGYGLQIGAVGRGKIVVSHQGPPTQVPRSGPTGTLTASRRLAFHCTSTITQLPQPQVQ